MDAVAAHERASPARLLDGARRRPGVRVSGRPTAADRRGAVSFALDGVHPHDVGQLLDARGIAVRVGHHCAKPLHRRFGRAAPPPGPGATSTPPPAEVDAFVDGLRRRARFFGAAVMARGRWTRCTSS